MLLAGACRGRKHVPRRSRAAPTAGGRRRPAGQPAVAGRARAACVRASAARRCPQERRLLCLKLILREHSRITQPTEALELL